MSLGGKYREIIILKIRIYFI